jgi:hypothetical protein
MPLSPRLLRPKAAASTGFDPRSIANLVWWLDASDVSTMSQNSDGTGAVAANGDPVGRINNKASASFNATQPTNNLRPTLLTSGMGGRPALSLSSTANSGFSSVPKVTSSSTVTYFFVGRYTGSAGWLTLWSSSSFMDAAQSGSIASPNQTSGTPTYRANRAAIAATRAAIYSAGNNANLLLTVRSLDMSSVQSNQWGGATWRFLDYDGTFNFQGVFSEVLLYAHNLSDAEVTAVENGLAAKWGIA